MNRSGRWTLRNPFNPTRLKEGFTHSHTAAFSPMLFGPLRLFDSTQYKLAQRDPATICTGLYENFFNSKNKRRLVDGELLIAGISWMSRSCYDALSCVI